MCAYSSSSPSLREDLGAVLEVEVVDVLGGVQRAVVLVRSCKHGGDKPTGASPSYHIKIVCNSCIRTIQFLANIDDLQKLKYTNTLRQIKGQKQGYIGRSVLEALIQERQEWCLE